LSQHEVLWALIPCVGLGLVTIASWKRGLDFALFPAALFVWYVYELIRTIGETRTAQKERTTDNKGT